MTINNIQSKRTWEYSMVCPFCNTTNYGLYHTHNLFCSCGAKYYAKDKIWLNRTTGEEVYIDEQSKIVCRSRN